jgi:hypothetical protein
MGAEERTVTTCYERGRRPVFEISFFREKRVTETNSDFVTVQDGMYVNRPRRCNQLGVVGLETIGRSRRRLNALATMPYRTVHVLLPYFGLTTSPC